MVMRPGISVFTGSPLQDITPEIVNLQQQLNNLSTVLGDLTALPTADKTSLVNSLKEVNNGFGNLSKSFSSSAPTTGTWGLADKVWNSAPVAGGNLGWICVQAGTFGTGTPPVFKQFGIISA